MANPKNLPKSEITDHLYQSYDDPFISDSHSSERDEIPRESNDTGIISNQFSWSNNAFQMKIHNFDSSNSGVNSNLPVNAPELSYFILFF